MMGLLLFTALVVFMQHYAKAELDIATCKMDVVFTLDRSSSIRGAVQPGSPDPWVLMTGFTQSLVKQINVSPAGSHVGAVLFADSANIQFGLKDSESEVLDRIGKLEFRGGTTNTTDALDKSRQILTDPQYGFRAGLPKILVLITDGNPNEAEMERVFVEAQTCRNAGIRTVVVGVTEFVNEDVLTRISYQTDDYVHVTDFNQLDDVKNKIITEEACQPVPTSTLKPPTTTLPPITSPPKPPITIPPTPSTSKPKPPPPQPVPNLPECDYPHLVIF
jgi:hypothetical protein